MAGLFNWVLEPCIILRFFLAAMTLVKFTKSEQCYRLVFFG